MCQIFYTLHYKIVEQYNIELLNYFIYFLTCSNFMKTKVKLKLILIFKKFKTKNEKSPQMRI